MFVSGSRDCRSGYDGFGQARWTKYDGNGQGEETIDILSAGDERVLLFSFHDDGQEFESISLPSHTPARTGFVMQLTVQD